MNKLENFSVGPVDQGSFLSVQCKQNKIITMLCQDITAEEYQR